MKREINITIPIIQKKKKKKAVNYYLSIETINQLKKKAKEYNMKDSVLLEEILEDVLKNI